MKRLLLLFVVFPSLLFSQVGVGTTSPNATLDIAATNQGAPSNTDGLLIPRVDNFPTANPTINQNGMLVYATGSGTPSKGFYYWDHSIPAWVPLLGVKRINDLTDGKSDVDGSEDGSSVYLGIEAGAADDASDNKNVGVGFQSLENNSTGDANTAMGYRALRANTTGTRNIAIGHTALISNTTGNNNTGIGGQSLNSNTTGSSNVGIGAFNLSKNTTGINNVSIGNQGLRSNVFGEGNTALGDYSGRALDYLNTADNNNDFNVYVGSKAGDSDFNSSRNVYVGASAGGGNYDPYTSVGTPENKSGNVFIGYQSGYNESGSNRLYIENSNADANSSLLYGEFDTDVLRTNSTFQIHNPSTGGYQFPIADGTANQVLTTNGSGQLSFQSISNPNSNFSLVRASAGAQTPGAGDQIIDYNGESFDINNEFNLATDTFTALNSGYYEVEALITSTNTGGGAAGSREIAISVDGVKVSRVVFDHTGSGRLVRQISDVVQLNAGQTISIVINFNGATIDLAGGSLLNHINIRRIR